MKTVLAMVVIFLVMMGMCADKSSSVVDLGSLRMNITNLCIKAVRSEQVWEAGIKVKEDHGFSDTDMTELLSGCISMLAGRTDYKVSYYHLYGLMQRTCSTNVAQVLASSVRANRDELDVRFAFAAYCEVLQMDESCFSLGCEILDADESYGHLARSGVYKQVARWRRNAESQDNGILVQRCNSFYASRQNKDSDFRSFVSRESWPGSSSGGAQ